MYDTSADLCGRWAQLGALYPFARNHNHKEYPNQEFFRFGENVITAAKKSLATRYALIKHYYALFLESVFNIFFKMLFYYYLEST